ncbi:MAG: lyase family protein, partial [Chloroflexia bacterium]
LISFVRAAGETVGPERRWLHLGLTSSDVVDTALSMALLDSGDLLMRRLSELEEVLTRLAVRYRSTPTIGRTHGVHAEPTTFGYKVLVWVDESRRNQRRLQNSLDELRVGKLSGAVGTHANIPRRSRRTPWACSVCGPPQRRRRCLGGTCTPSSYPPSR